MAKGQEPKKPLSDARPDTGKPRLGPEARRPSARTVAGIELAAELAAELEAARLAGSPDGSALGDDGPDDGIEAEARPADGIEPDELLEPWQQRTKHLKPFQFKPGQIGNPRGPRPGTRNRLSEGFIAALCHDFEENGIAAIRKVRTYKPDAYLRIIASIIPHHIDLKTNSVSALKDDELDSLISAIRASIASIEGANTGETTEGKPDETTKLLAIRKAN